MNSRIASLLVSGTLFALAPVPAAAEDCKWYEFFCKPGEKIGQGIEKGADTVFSAINYWPWLIQKYHTGSPQEKAMAKELVTKVFGSSSIEGAQPFQATFLFEGVDTSKSPLEVIILRDYTTPDLKGKILEGNSADFSAHQVVGVAPPPQDAYEEYLADVANVRSRVDKAISSAFSSSALLNFNGVTLNPNSLQARTVCRSLAADASEPPIAKRAAPCSKHPEWVAARKALGEVVDGIMATVDVKTEKRAARPMIQVAYEGYKYLTLVFPSTQLEKQPNLVVSYSIHIKGQPDSSIPAYQSKRWSISQPSILAANLAFDSKRREHGGKYVAYILKISH